MNRTVARLNIEHFKRLLGKETTRPSGRPPPAACGAGGGVVEGFGAAE
jgi:hypothetical protein